MIQDSVFCAVAISKSMKEINGIFKVTLTKTSSGRFERLEEPEVRSRKTGYRRQLSQKDMTEMKVYRAVHQTSSHGDVVAIRKEVTTTQVTDREPIEVTVHVPLNLQPDNTWKECFKNPTTHAGVSFPATKVMIMGNVMEFRTGELEAPNDLSWTYKYIDQGNECYKKKIAEQSKKQNAQAEKEAKAQEKMRELTEKLRKI
jgi:hypothetical protein